jgi:hypothetical protein
MRYRPTLLAAIVLTLTFSSGAPPYAATATCPPTLVSVSQQLESAPTPRILTEDILAGAISAISDPIVRADFRTLIEEVRAVPWPQRGRTTYERVLLSAVQSHGDIDAILATRLPLVLDGEAVLANLLRSAERMEPCGAGSVCDPKFLALPHQLRIVFLPTETAETLGSPAFRARVTEIHTNLVTRLRAIQARGYSTYGELLQCFHEFEEIGDFGFSIQSILDNPASSDRQRSAVQLETYFAVKTTTQLLMNPAYAPGGAGLEKALDLLSLGRIPTLSMRNYGEAEISPAHYSAVHFQPVRRPTMADGDLMPPLRFGNHDRQHAIVMSTAGDLPSAFLASTPVATPRSYRALTNLGAQLRQVRDFRTAWNAISRETERDPGLRARFVTSIYQWFHETGLRISSLNIYATTINELPTGRGDPQLVDWVRRHIAAELLADGRNILEEHPGLSADRNQPPRFNLPAPIYPTHPLPTTLNRIIQNAFTPGTPPSWSSLIEQVEGREPSILIPWERELLRQAMQQTRILPTR